MLGNNGKRKNVHTCLYMGGGRSFFCNEQPNRAIARTVSFNSKGNFSFCLAMLFKFRRVPVELMEKLF